MSLFKEYATNIAFRVDLTRPMAATLWVINEYEQSHRGGRDESHLNVFRAAKQMLGAHTDPFTAASRALLRRGLVEWRDLPKKKDGHADWSAQTWRMTEAGRHVLALCQLAEIIPASSNVVPLRKKRAA